VTDKRRYERCTFQNPVNVCTATRKDRAGMARDLSPIGVLFRSRSKFAIGERVVLTLRTPSNDLTSAEGRVVRSMKTPDYDMFPHMTVVEFDVPHLDLVGGSAAR
jgi:hypothetical protein